MEGSGRALVLCLVPIAGTVIEHVPCNGSLFHIVQAACHQVLLTVQHVKAWKIHFFSGDPISNTGDKEEILGDGTDIHRGSSDESNQEL